MSREDAGKTISLREGEIKLEHSSSFGGGFLLGEVVLIQHFCQVPKSPLLSSRWYTSLCIPWASDQHFETIPHRKKRKKKNQKLSSQILPPSQSFTSNLTISGTWITGAGFQLLKINPTPGRVILQPAWSSQMLLHDTGLSGTSPKTSFNVFFAH